MLGQNADAAATSGGQHVIEPGWVGAPESPRVCLHLALRTKAPLMIANIRAEIERIWRLNGVAVLVPATDTDGRCQGVISRSIVAFLADGPASLHESWRSKVPGSALGATLRTRDVPGAVVYAFVDHASQIIDGAPSQFSPDERLALVLGRVIAHEMGHSLLQCLDHTRDGLMRPHFDSSDSRLADEHMFELTSAQRAAVQSLLASQPTTAMAMASRHVERR